MVFIVLDLPGTNPKFRHVYILRDKSGLESLNLLVRTQAFLTDSQKQAIIARYNYTYNMNIHVKDCEFYGYSGFAEL